MNKEEFAKAIVSKVVAKAADKELNFRKANTNNDIVIVGNRAFIYRRSSKTLFMVDVDYHHAGMKAGATALLPQFTAKVDEYIQGLKKKEAQQFVWMYAATHMNGHQVFGWLFKSCQEGMEKKAATKRQLNLIRGLCNLNNAACICDSMDSELKADAAIRQLIYKLLKPLALERRMLVDGYLDTVYKVKVATVRDGYQLTATREFLK